MDSHQRDQGLLRLSRITSWVVGGAVVLAGVFSAVVAYARPGRSTTTNTSSGSPTATSLPAGDNFFQVPSQAPSRSSGRGFVTSGAS